METMTSNAGTRHILIIVSPYYKDISSELLKGAKQALTESDATYEEFEVPGALEIPQAFAAAIDNGLFDDEPDNYFHGVVVLGCVIRGETSHYDIVANESASAVMRLAINECIPLGNGILTVENKDQAMARAATSQGNKGRDAANACLRLIELNGEFTRIAEDGDEGDGGNV